MKTLTETLLELGYTHKSTGRNYRHNILDDQKKIVFTGTASETWEWLKK